MRAREWLDTDKSRSEQCSQHPEVDCFWLTEDVRGDVLSARGQRIEGESSMALSRHHLPGSWVMLL